MRKESMSLMEITSYIRFVVKMKHVKPTMIELYFMPKPVCYKITKKGNKKEVGEVKP